MNVADLSKSQRRFIYILRDREDGIEPRFRLKPNEEKLLALFDDGWITIHVTEKGRSFGKRDPDAGSTCTCVCEEKENDSPCPVHDACVCGKINARHCPVHQDG